MIEVGETPEAVDAVIVEEKAKLQVVLDKSKKELPVSETKDTTTETTDSIAFYDKLQVSIETQVEEVKKTVKDSYAPESEVTKIDVHAVKEDFKKAVEVELVEAKTVVYKDAGVTESEVTVIATKPIEHVKHETVNVCKPTKPVTKDTTVIVAKPVEGVTVVEEVKKHADVIVVEDVKKQTEVVVEEKLSTEVIETVEHIEVVSEKTNGWFVHFIEKINSMLEVGDCAEDVNAVIVEEEAKLQVVLEKSKTELPVSGSKDTKPIDSIAFYDKLQVSIGSQVDEIKKTVKETYVPGSEVIKIDVHTVKEDFKKAVEVEIVEAKTVVYKDAGVTESEVTVIATKPIEHIKHETVNVCKPATKDANVIVTKPVAGEVIVVEDIKKDTEVVHDVKKPCGVVNAVVDVVKDEVVEGEVKIVEGEVKIVEGEVKIVEGEVKIVEGEAQIVEGEVKVVESEVVKKDSVVVVEKKLPVEVIETVEHIEVVSEKTNGWFVHFIEKINSMLEVGDCAEDVNAVIVEEEAKLQVVLETSKTELPVSGSKDTKPIDSIAFYDKLQVSIGSQVDEIKKTVKETYVPGSEVTKIDVHTVKEDFKKAVEVELVEAKTVVYKDAGVTESEVIVIATKPIEHVKYDTVNVCEPTKPTTKDTTVIVTKPVEGVTVVEEVKKHADVNVVKDVVEEKLSTEVIETVEHIEVVTDKTNTWFGKLVEKVNGMIEVGETPEAVDAVIVEEKAKLQVVLDKSKKELPVSETKDTTTETTDSIAFYDKLQVSIETQVEEVKKTVKDSYAPESEVTKIDVHAVKEDFKKAVEVELVEAKTVVYKDAGVTESEVTVIATKPIEHVKHETVNVCKPTKPVTKDTTVIFAKPVEGVTVVEEVKKHADVIVVEDVKKQTDVIVEEKLSTEVIETVEHIEVVSEKTNGWFVHFIEKINSMLEVGDCAEDVNAVIVEEEAKLQVVLEKSKTELPVSGSKDTKPIDSIAFYDKLQVSIGSQVDEIKKTVKETYVPGSEVTKIDVHTVKEDFKKAVEVEIVEAKTVVYKDAGVTESEVTVIATKPIEHVKHETVNVCKPIKITKPTKDTTIIVTKPSTEIIHTGSVIVTKPMTKDEIIYETVEQAETETRKALTITVEATKSRFSAWYDVFYGRIRAIPVGGEHYKTEVQKVITSSLEEAQVIIKESKAALDYSVPKECDAQIISTVKTTQKQAIESLDTIYTIVSEQVTVIEQVVSTTDVELIQEKIQVIEEQSRRKTCTAIESTTETAISAGFEGKTITWVETTRIPASFKGVKVFAFDLIDSVVNYRASISKAWYLLVNKKSACTFAHINVQQFIIRWYSLYLQLRIEARYSVSDSTILLNALRLILVEFSIESAFTESELITLCSAWLKLELFEDASASIRKIKQLDGVYAVAISHAFSIRTMMDLARSGCLCWHAQFTADMFAACTINNGTSEEVTVVSNTAMLLGLNDASELAVVSSNPKILAAAKENGSKTVLINRYGLEASGAAEADVSAVAVAGAGASAAYASGVYSSGVYTSEVFDLEFSALDIFSESFESFYYESEVVYTKVEVPVTRSWFQRVVSTVTETAETVSHAIIG
ncbi:hypothetical protein INT47_006469 [Mucor saturninus]|uniref:Uncharacterized protein n=1 Tax=Mucor saturninus TaxID=64648 RepID=A0A8H7UV39_9FUNG|nr:hypothetical protein INT47_006469 [Mucor saturninus]